MCQSCLEIKPFSEFHKRSKALDGLQTRCKVCNKKQRVEYYRTAAGKSKNDLTGRRWGAKMRRKVYEYLLTHPCVDCGEADPIVLEFDHRDRATKNHTISQMIHKFGWEKILEEIEKCDVRCSNCHKKVTAKQFGWAKLSWQDGPLA